MCRIKTGRPGRPAREDILRADRRKTLSAISNGAGAGGAGPSALAAQGCGTRRSRQVNGSGRHGNGQEERTLFSLVMNEKFPYHRRFHLSIWVAGIGAPLSTSCLCRVGRGKREFITPVSNVQWMYPCAPERRWRRKMGEMEQTRGPFPARDAAARRARHRQVVSPGRARRRAHGRAPTLRREVSVSAADACGAGARDPGNTSPARPFGPCGASLDIWQGRRCEI